MKLGEIITFDGKQFLVEANILQILKGEGSCEGCYFSTGKPVGPAGDHCAYDGEIYCGGYLQTPDQQFIFKEIEP